MIKFQSNHQKLIAQQFRLLCDVILLLQNFKEKWKTKDNYTKWIYGLAYNLQ